MVSPVSKWQNLIDFTTEDIWEGVKFAYGVSRVTQENVFWIIAEKDKTRKTLDFYAIDDLSIEWTKLFWSKKVDRNWGEWEWALVLNWETPEATKGATNEDIAIAMAEFLSEFIESIYEGRTLNLRIKIDPKIPLAIYEKTLIILEKWCKIDSGSLNNKSGYMLLTYE